MSELRELEKQIEQSDVISFDIFDTLLLRNVLKPSDIFEILAKKVKEKYKIKNFKEKRIEAEEKSRLEINNFETTLDEIYTNLNINDKSILDDIKNMELDIEEEFLVANPFMKEIYEYCLKKGKKVLCITDMYLPKKFIENVLNKNGYNNIKVYLSCDYRKNKNSGKLYEEVYKIEKFKKSKWLHIGDNIYSDVESANKFGINSYHYIKVSERQKDKIELKELSNRIIFAICNNYLNNGLDIEEELKKNILELIPLYYDYACFILKNINSNTLYFDEQSLIIKKIIESIIKYNNIKLITNKLDNKDKNVKNVVTIIEDIDIDAKNCFYLLSKKSIFNRKKVFRKMNKEDYEKYYRLLKNSNLLNYKGTEIIIDKLAKYYKYIIAV